MRSGAAIDAARQNPTGAGPALPARVKAETENPAPSRLHTLSIAASASAKPTITRRPSRLRVESLLCASDLTSANPVRLGSMGLLIVNADDLGLDVSTTDSILRCFRAGRVSSASALVWMSDSRRAAELAREANLPIRLHLNLTEPFTDPSVPADVRGRQGRMARHFARWPIAYWICNPLRQSTIEACIRDQMHQFDRLYGELPREVDGHQHVHTCLNVLLARSLGNVEAMRATFNLPPDDEGLAKRGVQRAINGAVRLRFESTQWFTYLRKGTSCRSVQDLARIIARAKTESVELMTHPGGGGMQPSTVGPMVTGNRRRTARNIGGSVR